MIYGDVDRIQIPIPRHNPELVVAVIIQMKYMTVILQSVVCILITMHNSSDIIQTVWIMTQVT